METGLARRLPFITTRETLRPGSCGNTIWQGFPGPGLGQNNNHFILPAIHWPAIMDLL